MKNNLAGKEFIPIYQIYVEHSSLVGRGLDWRLKGCWFETHHWQSLAQDTLSAA